MGIYFIFKKKKQMADPAEDLSGVDVMDILISGATFYVLQMFDFQMTIFNTGNYLKKIKELTEFQGTDVLEETLSSYDLSVEDPADVGTPDDPTLWCGGK